MRIYPTGSYFICNPPVLNTDIDFIIFTENLDDFCQELEKIGFKQDGVGGYPINNFVSYKLKTISTVINYIITDKEDWYNKFVIATDIAKKLNLIEKQKRIELFDSILK